MATKKRDIVKEYADLRRKNIGKIPGMMRCEGSECPNGGATSALSDDTLIENGKAWCSVCRPDWNSSPEAFDRGPFQRRNRR